MELRQEIGVKQVQTISPQFILSQRILQLTSMELRNEITQELSENPALEMEEITTCPHCHRRMEGNRCEYCGKKPEDDAQDETDKFVESQAVDYDPDEAPYTDRYEAQDDSSSFMNFYQQPGDFHELLLTGFYTADYPRELRELGEYLIYSINEDGYLKIDREAFHENIVTLQETMSDTEPRIIFPSRDIALMHRIHTVLAQSARHPITKQLAIDMLEQLGVSGASPLMEFIQEMESCDINELSDFFKAMMEQSPDELAGWLENLEGNGFRGIAKRMVESEAAPGQVGVFYAFTMRGGIKKTWEELCTAIQKRLAAIEGHVERMIQVIQTLDPPGIGAETPQQALLIQLKALDAEGVTHPLAQVIIENYFEDLGKSRLSEIASALKVSVAEVNRALDFIRRNLTPHPGRALIREAGEPVQLARPSIEIKYKDKKLTYEILELNDFRLRINNYYIDMYRKHQKGLRNVPSGEMQHIRQYFKRAKFFMDSINSRRETLEKIAEALILEQRDFLMNGLPHFNSDITQTQLAEKIGLHESTVSRAMSQKFVRIPSGEIVSFDFFFDSSVRPKEYMKNYIGNENPDKPLSDQELQKLLSDRAIHLARRTVAKYREEMNVPSSYQRKRMKERRASWLK